MNSFANISWLASSLLNVTRLNKGFPIRALHQFDIKPIIGLEVHAQLNTKSKLFSQGANNPIAPPNTQLDLLDVSLPGSLPKLNSAALSLALIAALGLNCTIQDVIHFDRKNYFYTDMPAGYQITQYDRPIAKNGHLDFIASTYHHSVIAHSQHYDIGKYAYPDSRYSAETFTPYKKRSNVKQIQLEQDSAKTLDQTKMNTSELSNLVDYNRSGSALIEIVFEPDLTDADEASSLVRELILLLRSLEVCTCRLQEGSLRVDANVSIASINGQMINKEMAKRVELKNLNSLKSLARGIKSEMIRQTSEIMMGNKIVQESRSYDTKSDKTLPLRLKEEVIDYRYMPEPSLPPLRIETSMVEEMRARLPKSKLPSSLRRGLRAKYNLDYLLIIELMDEPGLCDYFDKIMQKSDRNVHYDPDTLADFLIYAIANLKRVEISPTDIDLIKLDGDFWRRFEPDKMQALFDLLFSDRISFMSALDVMKMMLTQDDLTAPDQLIDEFDLYLENDDEKIMEACKKTLDGMKNIRKKFLKTGDRKYVRLILNKLTELYDGRLSLRKAVECLHRIREENA